MIKHTSFSTRRFLYDGVNLNGLFDKNPFLSLDQSAKERKSDFVNGNILQIRVTHFESLSLVILLPFD